MTANIELDGCKILKEVEWISVIEDDQQKIEEIFNRIAEKKVNLLFVSYLNQGDRFINIGIKPEFESQVLEQIAESSPKSMDRKSAVVLSVFPHRNNPEIVGKVLQIYEHNDPEEIILVNSFSAISIICSKKILKQSMKFFFEHFQFKRPIEDWTRVYREKEHICKEVIASYQEKRPKVYFLEYRDHQSLIYLELNSDHAGKYVGNLLPSINKDTSVTYLASTPKQDGSILVMSIHPYDHIMQHDKNVTVCHDMVVFSMNGPHFGDRYGIVHVLFKALNENDVELIGLNCSTHSITGIMPRNDLECAIDSLRSYFEIPSIINRT